MSPADLYQTAAAALLIGALIGAFGIGGVLLAPWLTHVVGLPVHEAVAITMLSFVAPGAVALARAAPAMRRSMPGRVRLVLATAPGALAGSAALWIVPERAALVVLAVATSAIGVRLLVAPEGAGPRACADAASIGWRERSGSSSASVPRSPRPAARWS